MCPQAIFLLDIIAYHVHISPCHYKKSLPLPSRRGTVCVSSLVVSASLQPHGLYPVRLLCPWDSPGKNTGVDCHSLNQGVHCMLAKLLNALWTGIWGPKPGILLHCPSRISLLSSCHHNISIVGSLPLVRAEL